MDSRSNPFNDLYVTETTPSASFVKIFSPKLLHSAEPLFLPGNVVLKGVQGSGKSMLLNLLRPDIRVAYQREKAPFPLTGRYAKFLSAGINLTTSGVTDFGQRPITGSLEQDRSILPLFFGDFLNYRLVYDILDTLDTYKNECEGSVGGQLGLRLDRSSLDQFAKSLATSPCWFGYLADVSSYDKLRARLGVRINEYLRYLSFNTDSIPPDIQRTKTLVGEPVAQAADAMRREGVLPEDVHLFIRIDQYEELCRLETLQFEGYGPMYRSVVNKALGLRNASVSYRVGTRGYAWEDSLDLYGTTARLERDRNYKLIDLDELLRRKENRKTWLFPAFAEDVFSRRLKTAGFLAQRETEVLEAVFGRGSTPERKAIRYCGNTPEKSVRPDPKFPLEWKKYLAKLATTDPLAARLADGWARQKGKRQIVTEFAAVSTFPWDTPAKKYWKKERIQQALMQIAGRCRQRPVWGGRSDILELSGGNILVFVSFCQHIWSAWLRSVREGRDVENPPLVIDETVQAVGVHEASNHWFNKLAEETGGNRRQRFIRLIGSAFEKTLYLDAALSYPGHNGFSVMLDDLDADVAIKNFLNDAVDYGALFDAPHKTKERNRRLRRKFYLNPVLSPYFRIPHIHTKEPLYVEVKEVRTWMQIADSVSDTSSLEIGRPEISRPKKKVSEQSSLFD